MQDTLLPAQNPGRTESSPDKRSGTCSLGHTSLKRDEQDIEGNRRRGHPTCNGCLGPLCLTLIPSCSNSVRICPRTHLQSLPR